MSYRDLLYTYGSPSKSAEHRVYIYVQAPECLQTTTDVVHRDKSAAQDIERLQKLVDNLKDYRQALAARYGQLETMSYKRRLSLVRDPSRYSGIRYRITIQRIYEDGTTSEELHESYEGKERHVALKRFGELLKQYPGIESEKDISKKHWEK